MACASNQLHGYENGCDMCMKFYTPPNLVTIACEVFVNQITITKHLRILEQAEFIYF